MPFKFLSKGFTTPKTPPRRSQSLNSLNRSEGDVAKVLSEDFNRIKMRLGRKTAMFEDGKWKTDENTGHATSYQAKRIEELESENRILKLKNELLVDMLTEKSAEHLILEKSFNKIKLKQPNLS